MRSHIRSENIRRIAELAPGQPYIPFEPDEFRAFTDADYLALPPLPCTEPGWRLLCTHEERVATNAVSWATEMVRVFRVAENSNKTVGVMRHPKRNTVAIFVKVR